MSSCVLNSVVRRLRQAVAGDGESTDGQLLTRYLVHRDQSAFEVLVRRHGPTVLGVCRRVLGNVQDAEDAFQATFLVLVRKGHAIRETALLGNWLYGVAYRTALKARSMGIKRRRFEQQPRDVLQPDEQRHRFWTEIQPLLDQELCALPEKYRIAILMCDLEGQSRTEAARRLGWPAGTVATRLAEGRSRLAKRLARHGITLSGGMLAMVLSENSSRATVSPSLIATTTSAVSGAAVPDVAALADEVVRSTLLTKLKVATIALVLGVALGLGLNLRDSQGQVDNALQVIVDKKTDVVGLNQPNEAAAIKEIHTPPPKQTGLEMAVTPLDRLLVEWENAMAGVNAVSAEMQRIAWQNAREPAAETRFLRGQNGLSSRASLYLRRVKPPDSDAAELRYTVQYLPGLARVRPSPEAYLYERYVHNGGNSLLYVSDPTEKMLRMQSLPSPSTGRITDDSFLSLVFDVRAGEAKKRFRMSYIGDSPEQADVYHRLKVMPLLAHDKADFTEARVVLYAKTYMPRQVWFRQPDGKTVTWNFLKADVNLTIPPAELAAPALPAGWTLVHAGKGT